MGDSPAAKKTRKDASWSFAAATDCQSSATPPSPPIPKTLEKGKPTATNGQGSALPPSPPNPKTLEKGEPAHLNPGPPEVESVASLAEKNVIRELRKQRLDFDPKSVATWEDGDPVPFLFLAKALHLVSSVPDSAIMYVIRNVFCTVIATTPRDLLAVVYLMTNRITPPHEEVGLGINAASLLAAVADARRMRRELDNNIRVELRRLASKKPSSQKMALPMLPPPLTVAHVFDTFRAIAKETGPQSQNKKRNHIKQLLMAATDCEYEYLMQFFESMPTDLAEEIVPVALGQAALYSDMLPSPSSLSQQSLEEASQIMKQVHSILPDYDRIVPSLLQVGVWKLPETCGFSLGVPVRPMSVKPVKSLSEILDIFHGKEFTCEYKYDGERAQIHYMEDGSVEIYGRNAERNSGKYPDIVNSVPRFKKAPVTSFVLDCEIVAYDCEKQKILPSQILTSRARKDAVLSDIKVAVCTFAFDLLYLNGQSLIQEQFKVRRELLYNSFVEEPGLFQYAIALTSSNLEEIQKFLDNSVNSCCEGLVIKTLDGNATYEPWKQSNNWLKLKKDYMDSFEGQLIKKSNEDATYRPSKRLSGWLKLDNRSSVTSVGGTLDLVPIAAYYGGGKRTGDYCSFLLACYDEKKKEYQSMCHIDTEFSVNVSEEHLAILRNCVISKPEPFYVVGAKTHPDVWFEPVQVWEVTALDLTISSVYCAAKGVVDSNKGISLRFPRLIRIRDDKNPDQATTAEQVGVMFRI